MLKCLVLDLDNTIWGGVVGEDGIDGIRLTPGYLAVQQAALDLRARGILIAACSKNNEREALDVLWRPDMLLRVGHLADWRINWLDKCVNLREIAGYLKIGTDTLAFADDSPVERGLAKAEMPEVAVIDLPDDPAGYAAAILAAFPETVTTDEDKRRSGYYSEQKARMEAEAKATSREEFLQSLGLELEVGRATAETIPRIAQLSQRTNQFTLTGRKYEEGQLAAILNNKTHRVYWGRARDKFGDYGVIAAAIVEAAEAYKPTRLDTVVEFYLSCRAMGKGIEYAFLEAIREGNVDCRMGSTKTDRNVPAMQFVETVLAQHGVPPTPWIRIRRAWEAQPAVYTRIHDIACKTFDLPPSALTPESSAEDVPEWDSLASVNLMLAIEGAFDIVFTAEEMEIAPNLGQLAKMVEEKRRVNAAG